MITADQLQAILQRSGLETLDENTLQPREARFAGAPSCLSPEVSVELRRSYPQGLYVHQAKAIRTALLESDVCLATSTASGKSLAFISVAAHMLHTDPAARVLALYPMRALIRDQISKWVDGLRAFSESPVLIDGGVPIATRNELLARHRVILMTPDVAHAWLMSHTSEPTVAAFLSQLKLLILDEAHVYDGVFGTNAAYLIRRLLAKSAVERVISSTATIGAPQTFIQKLTGRDPVVIASEDDGSPQAGKSILLTRRSGSNSLDAAVALLRSLAEQESTRFIAFADSRKLVEQLVAISHRETDDEGDTVPSENVADGIQKSVLPYRSGYEEEDRRNIQDALTKGLLRGVVSTSALELGIDIGEVDLVVLIDSPPTVKSFWQRLGRAGRRRHGICVLMDEKGTIAAYPGGLSGYLRREPETSWLYLDNRFVQYCQALCAAQENISLEENSRGRRILATLPVEFMRMLANEVNPTESIPTDLYPLKQRAQAGAHYEFPLRSSIEKSFAIKQHHGPNDRSLGTVNLSQMLREAYPGAIYHYLATPYRVIQLKYRAGEISVRRERHWTTQPILQNKVFPRFDGGVLAWRGSDEGFLAEAELQVSERVIGFSERRGPNRSQHKYGLGSPYSQNPIDRSFETTGVCWFFQEPVVLTELLGETVLEAFCALCGVEKRDVGVGSFHAKPSRIWKDECSGICIYDTVVGSLRLTGQLFERMQEVLKYAMRLVDQSQQPNQLIHTSIQKLLVLADAVGPQRVPVSGPPQPPVNEDSNWLRIIGPNQPAMLSEGGVFRHVQVTFARYTPSGLMYELPSERPGNLHLVRADLLHPINGVTQFIEMNFATGETRSLEDGT